MRPKKRVERTYSPQEKAEALRQLALNEGNLSKTAKETGISITNFYRWRDEQLRESKDFEAKNIEKFIKNAWRNIHALSNPTFIKRLRDRCLEKGDIKGIFTSRAILIDKAIMLTRIQTALSTETESGRSEDESKEIENLSEQEIKEMIAEKEKKQRRKINQ